MIIPYDTLIETGDRHHLAALMERIHQGDLSGHEEESLIEALSRSADPRSIQPLIDLIEDQTRPLKVRERVRVIFAYWEFALCFSREKLNQWWREGDDLLKKLALDFSDTEYPELIRSVASNPSHPLLADAVANMVFFFESREDVKLKIAALGHPDPAVRRAAAHILFWDEPVDATEALIKATRDEDEQVVVEALRTLRYFYSRRVFAHLHELKSSGIYDDRDEIDEALDEALADQRSEFLSCLTGNAYRDCHEALRKWLDPIWEMLNFSAEELEIEEDEAIEYKPSPPRREPISTTALLSRLRDENTSVKALRELFDQTDWPAIDEPDRADIRQTLLANPDPLRRELSDGVFRAWNDADSLRVLLQDPIFSVRKGAMYKLGELPRSTSLAPIIREYLNRHYSPGTHGCESLRAYVNHAPREDAVEMLYGIARDKDSTETLRRTAIEQLERLQAAQEIGKLLYILSEKPMVTWSLHAAVLNAAAKFDLPVDVPERLFPADELYLQIALAPYRD